MIQSNNTIILTQDDLNISSKDKVFDDITINDFNNKCSPLQFYHSDSVVYKHMLDNPDIPYLSKVIKETTINGQSIFNTCEDVTFHTTGYLQSKHNKMVEANLYNSTLFRRKERNI